MKYQGLIDDLLGQHCTFQNRAGVMCRFRVEDFPADDFAAINIEHHDKILILTFDGALSPQFPLRLMLHR